MIGITGQCSGEIVWAGLQDRLLSEYSQYQELCMMIGRRHVGSTCWSFACSLDVNV
jgi:hypothetical protein